MGEETSDIVRRERRRGTRVVSWDQFDHCREGCLLRRASLEAATVCRPLSRRLGYIRPCPIALPLSIPLIEGEGQDKRG